jgi:hypothetical protein
MRIGIIGGTLHSYPQYRRIAAASGHDVELHQGVMSSRGTATIEAMVRRCDLLVIATDVNSHAAVRVARDLSRTHGTATVLCRRFGVGRFASMVSEVSRVDR